MEEGGTSGGGRDEGPRRGTGSSPVVRPSRDISKNHVIPVVAANQNTCSGCKNMVSKNVRFLLVHSVDVSYF